MRVLLVLALSIFSCVECTGRLRGVHTALVPHKEPETMSAFRKRYKEKMARLTPFYDKTEPPKYMRHRSYTPLFPIDLPTIYEDEEDRLALLAPSPHEATPVITTDQLATNLPRPPDQLAQMIQDPVEMLKRFAKGTVPELFDHKAMGIDNKKSFVRFLRELFLKGSSNFPMVYRRAIKGHRGARNLIHALYDQTALNPIYYASHGADHGLRVMDNCLKGLHALRSHLTVPLDESDMMLSCLFHDIGYPDITPDESKPGAIAPPKWLHSVAGMALLSKTNFPKFKFHTINGHSDDERRDADDTGPKSERDLLDESIGNRLLEAVGLHNYGDTAAPADVTGFKFSDINRYPFMWNGAPEEEGATSWMHQSVFTASLNDNPYAFFTRLGDTFDIVSTRLSDFQDTPRTMRILWALWSLGTLGGYQLVKLPPETARTNVPMWLAAAIQYADEMDKQHGYQMTPEEIREVDANFHMVASRIPHILHNQFAHWYGNYAIDQVSMISPETSRTPPENQLQGELFNLQLKPRIGGTTPDLAGQRHVKWSVFQLIRASSGLGQLYINEGDTESIVNRIRVTIVDAWPQTVPEAVHMSAMDFVEEFIQNKALGELNLDALPDDDYDLCVETVDMLEMLAMSKLVDRVDLSTLQNRSVNVN